MDVKIDCPNCGFKIDLSQRILALVAEQSKKEAGRIVEEERKKAAEEAKRAAETAVEKARAEERAKAEKAKEQALNQLSEQRRSLENRLKEMSEANEKRRQEEENRLRARLEEQSNLLLEKQKLDFEKSFKEKIQRKDLQVAEQQKQLLEAQRRAQELELKLTQGSAQKRGIIAEEELFQYLKRTMPPDRCEVEKRGQGRKGTDVIIHVHRNGGEVGSIIIDDKWASTWGNDWPEKVWKDMQAHKADFAYIAVNPPAFPRGTEELKTSGFGLAPCKKAGVRVWVVDRSNLHLVSAILMDTVDKILKMADIKAVYGAGSEAVKKFQAYLTSGYETDLREKAKQMSIAVKSLNDLHKKVNAEYEKVMTALQNYWTTEKKVHDSISAFFGADIVKSIPQIPFDKGPD